MIKIFQIIIGLMIFISPISYLEAANFSVSPLMIDLEAEVRDTFTREITITSNHSVHQRLYASVHEITLGDKGEIKSFVPASMSDRSTSVTSWIEISRSRIDLQPDQATTTPLTIRVNHNTPAGLYHAYIGFAPGSNRDEAETAILAGNGTGVIVRIVVGGTQEEFLRLVAFTTDRFSILPGDGLITYTLENSGDVPLSPSGDIIIYDSRGHELANVTVNNDENPTIIAPGEKREFTSSVPFIERFGRLKAYLSVEYGSENRAALYDTNFYYSIPWYYLLIITFLLLTMVVSLILLTRKIKNNDLYDNVDATPLPVFFGRVREHNQYEHDIDLKKKNKEDSL